jgi:putative endonuclease
MWYVYIAQCGDDSLYTGITTDVEQRLKRHQRGRGSRYVRSKGAITLLYRELCHEKSAALRRELEIKAWSRQKKLALIAVGPDA